jgi:hypothetical protein
MLGFLFLVKMGNLWGRSKAQGFALVGIEMA